MVSLQLTAHRPTLDQYSVSMQLVLMSIYQFFTFLAYMIYGIQEPNVCTLYCVTFPMYSAWFLENPSELRGFSTVIK